MASIPLQPILPWATTERKIEEPANDSESEEEEDIISISLEDAELTIGSRIVVLWEVIPTDSEPTQKWWGATLEAKEATSDVDEEGAAEPHLFRLRYDPDGDFESECRDIAFLSKHWLCDFSTGQEMAWRKPEDTWEPEAAEKDEVVSLMDDSLVDHGDGTFSMKVMSESERERNMQLLSEDVGAIIADLPAVQQNFVAESVRDFLGDITDILKNVVESKARESSSGEEVVITAEDVQEAHEELKRKRARQA